MFLAFFSMLTLFFMFYLTESITAEKPCFNIKYSKKSINCDPKNQYYKFHNKSNLNDLEVVMDFVIENDHLNTQSFQTIEDNYSNYLKETTDKSVNLTKAYQDEIALWNDYFYSNTTMANITETSLPKFITQLIQFNNIDVPLKYSKVKENYVRSFEYEIKSYQLFLDYLKANNSIANKLSIDFLSTALIYETNARNAFIEANKNSSFPTDKENNINQQPLQKQLFISNIKIEQYVSNL